MSPDYSYKAQATKASTTDFPLFPKLPTEIRLAIWRQCLPARISELDFPISECVWFDVEPAPCTMKHTTWLNSLPPVLTRVCNESRDVAFESGGFHASTPDMPREARWDSLTVLSRRWVDRTRDNILLNWTPSYEAEYHSVNNPLRCLAWEANLVAGGASLMLDWLEKDLGRQITANQRIDALRLMPCTRVIVGIVIMHIDFKHGAETGLFGHLGDAPVQVVDVHDEERINALGRLTQEGKCNRICTLAQDSDMVLSKSRDTNLSHIIASTFSPENLAPKFHSAIMFRLCTQMCNS